MISNKTLKAIEYDKVVLEVAKYATLKRTKEFLINFSPVCDIVSAKFILDKTSQAYDLIYKYNVGGVYYFDDVSDELDRAEKGGTLNNVELLRVCSNLKSARLIKNSILSVNEENLELIKNIALRLFDNLDLEDEISSKILSEDKISDSASSKLYSIRKEISNLNAKIRERLNHYIHGGLNAYLQDAVITIRQDRYVVPVKSEFRSFVKGFIHDQSSSGATVFIEPEQIVELNNELKRATLNEQAEIYRILSELSAKVGAVSSTIKFNAENIQEIDESFARAQYSYKNDCCKPILSDDGVTDIVRGRHPLIDKDKVVPVSISFGRDYNFLLITGPNTGGKTVTLKLVGLLTCMAMSGLFLPASENTKIALFNEIYCDIGDEQSIEQNLSTFSSHVKNLINIINNVNEKSLVLIDEIGAGTDPDEGTALSLAVVKKLLSLNCFGIVTTHYSRLKEFAMETGKIENASMEFDSKSLKPLYKLNIGIPGSSNAIDIAKTLGLDESIVKDAISYLSEEKIVFERTLKRAEESRRQNEILSAELESIKSQKLLELDEIKLEKEKITKERERIYNTSKQETKRIVADKLVEAEEIIASLKKLLKQSNLESKDVFKASELRNRLANSKYLSIETDNAPLTMLKPKKEELEVGRKVYVKSLDSYAIISQVKQSKKEIEVLVGNIKTLVKIDDVFNSEIVKEPNKKVNIYKNTNRVDVALSINVIGKTSLEAVNEVQDFIDRSVVNGLTEVKIIHGVGEGVLLKSIRDYLKTDRNVLEYRKGKYGEGENGVTIVTLK